MLKPILSPINPDSPAGDITNLQDALLFLFEQGQFITRTPPDQPSAEELAALVARLRRERVQETYGEATRQLVFFFQLQSGLGDNSRGFVDDRTSTRLNELLESLGAFKDDTDENYLVFGTVTDERNAPVQGLQVVAYDRDVTRESELGEDVTSAEGKYRIPFQESAFRQTAAERGGPDLIVRVFADGSDEEIGRSRLAANAGRETELSVQLARERFVVKGMVRSAEGKPAANLRVKAVDHDLRRKQKLGETQTKTDGTYAIVYTHKQFTRAEKDNADLGVQVYAKDGDLLVASDIYFNASPELVVDLTLPSTEALSEWERIGQVIVPLLASQGKKGQALTPAELDDNDINFIVRDTGLDREQVRLWVLAEKTAHEVQMISTSPTPPDESDDKLESMTFYGWFRDGQPQQFRELILRSTDLLMASFDSAVRQRYIPALDKSLREKLQQALDSRRIDEVLKPAGEDEPASLGDVLRTIEADWLVEDKQREIALLLQEVTVESEDFMSRMQEILPEESHRIDLRRTLRLGELTMQHTELVKALHPIAQESEDDSLRSLASITPDRWLDLAYAHGTAPGSYLETEIYARRLEEQVEEQEPTAVLVHRLQALPFFAEMPEYSGLASILRENGGFNIQSGDIGKFAEEAGLDEQQKSALRRLQQMKRIGARWDEAAVLLEQGIDSFATVVSMGEEQFHLQLKKDLEEPRIRSIYAQANAFHAAGIGLMGYLQPMLYGVTPAVMTSYKDDPKAIELIESNPTLRSLFGALESCACVDCLSVLSPSAYLADLLKFIDGNLSASFELRGRRPDLYDLELSCDNSKTELPHIDLAIEILENKVALPKVLELPLGTDILAELSRTPLDETIREELQKTASEPLGDLTAVKDKWSRIPLIYRPGVSYWVVADRHRRWVLEASEAYFGLSQTLFGGIDLANQNIEDIIAAMDAGQVHPGIETSFKQALIKSRRPGVPLIVESISIKTEEAGRRWEVDFTLKGWVKIEVETDSMSLFAIEDRVIERNYSPQALSATEQALLNGKIGGILSALTTNFGPDATVMKQDSGYSYSESYKATVFYRPASLKINGLTYQSTKTDIDLFAQPQNRNPLAYEVLRSTEAVFPWSLPYDAFLHEARLLLEKAGLTRLSLLQAMSPYQDRPDHFSIAQEQLQISDAETELIVGDTTASLWGCWGLSPDENGDFTVFDSFSDTPLIGKPEDLLRTVSVVMQQAKLSFDELQTVLTTRFVNPGGKAVIKPFHECDPTKLLIEEVSDTELAALLDAMHRFLRLQRVLKWRISSLDQLLSSSKVAPADLDRKALHNLVRLQSLSKRFSLPVQQVAGWLDKPSESQKALRTALGLTEDEYESARIVLAGQGDPLSSVAALVKFIEEIDFAKQYDQQWVTLAYALNHDSPDIDVLEFPISRTVSLFRELRREFMPGIQELADLRTLFPLPPANDKERWKRWGLYPPQPGATAWSVPDPDDSAKVLKGTPLNLLKNLKVLAQQSRVNTDHLKALLVAPFIEKKNGQELKIKPKSATDPTLVIDGLKREHLDKLEIAVKALLSSRPDTLAFKEAAATFSKLFGKEFTESSKLATVLLIWQKSPDLIDRLIDRLATELPFEAPLVEELLFHGFALKTQPSAIEIFIDLLFKEVKSELNENDVASAHVYMVRLYKLALLNRGWKASAGEMAWLRPLEDGKRFLGLKPDDLPIQKGNPSVNYLAWKQTTKLFALAHLAPGLTPVLDAYLVAIEKKPADRYAGFDLFAIAFRLQSNTGPGEGLDSVKSLATILGLSNTLPLSNGVNARRLDPLWLADLFALLAMAQRMNATGDELNVLAAAQPDDRTLTAARKLLQQRAESDAAQQALHKVADSLREARRDRLVDYLLQRDGVRDANALYERYLIDPEMSSCLRTTRILQATAATQLFVQRCLMNLEENVSPEFINQERWEWMRNYRVWEANRKVFLYPENWLFPELRDDRTETFRAFESALTQSEPSHENATQALRQYLEDLREVSQISIRGIYEHAEETKEVDEFGRKKVKHSLFLVGRMPNPPYVFFCRTAFDFGQLGMRWTGWERIDQDISGDHIIPFVFEGDLHVAWPVIKQIEREQKTFYEVQLAWTKRTSAGWTQRKVSRDSLEIEKLFNRDERSMFNFKLNPTNAATNEHDAIQIEVFVAKPPNQVIAEPHNPNMAIVSVWNNPYPHGKSWRLIVYANSYVRYHNNRVEKLDLNLRIIGLHKIKDANGRTFFYQGSESEFEEVTQNIYPAFRSHDVYGSIKLRFEARAFGKIQHVEVNQILNPGGASEVSINVNFLFTGIQDLNPSSTDATFPLSMISMGKFVLVSGRDAHRVPSGSEELKPQENAFFWSSGLLEREHGGISPLSPGFAESMFLLQAPNSLDPEVQLLYVEEGVRRLIASRQKTSGQWLSLNPCGYPEASLYLREASSKLSNLYQIEMQQKGGNSWFTVDALANWIPKKISQDPRDNTILGFDLKAANALYNWEIFYHLPIAVAHFLCSQHRFDDARRWFHFVFDPTTNEPATPGSEMVRFWKFLPFRHKEQPESIIDILEALANPQAPADMRDHIQGQIDAWLDDPFNPFAIARMRPAAFEWFTVIAYVKNLIEWGDQLFRRDTRESINEATLLYVLAANILGRKPEKIAPRGNSGQAASYRTLEGKWDEFSNAWLALADSPFVQAWMEWLQWLAKSGINPQSAWDQLAQLSSVGLLYFCVPPNEKLPELWDKVESRLFNIRHCRYIDGIQRELPLYEAPIDPELLIRAKAAGLDLKEVVAGRFATTPLYRFQMLVQKANEFCNEVKGLGAALLSALEKKEAEHLTLLRSKQEIDMLRLVESIKKEQIKEAEANLEALQKTRSNALERFTYLQRQLGKSEIQYDPSGAPIVEQTPITSIQQSDMPGDFRGLALIQSEIDQIWRLQDGHWATVIAAGSKTAAGALKTAAASAKAELTGSAKEVLSFLGEAASYISEASALFASNASFWEKRAGLIAGWQRRYDEWVQQSKMTAEEIRQIDKQILTQQIRKNIADKDLENHQKQIEFARNIDDYLRSLKFTNKSLYMWMESQLANLYFDAYQMAFELAKRAELAFQFETGDTSTRFINYGQWDKLRAGLLSGEQLSQQLRRMEVAYLERNRREFELTKHISLVQLDPLALVKLKETGRCFFRLPEEIFDLDYPGHYFRRIKSVSITLPCVVGPYITLSCTLRLLRSSIRLNTNNGNDGYARNIDDQGLPVDDNRFVESNIPVKAIAASNAQNDSGVFELSFRDERFLPFEGAGVVSEWSLELFSDSENTDFGKPLRQFDYSTISDAILQVKYTAREDAGQFKNDAIAHLREYYHKDGATPSLRMINLRQEFPTQWHRFLHPTKPADGNILELELTSSIFPFRDSGKTLKVNMMWLLARCKKAGIYEVVMTPPLPEPPPDGSNTMTLTQVAQYGGLHFGQKGDNAAPLEIEMALTDQPAKWQIKMTRPGGGNLQKDEVDEVLLVLGYEWEQNP